MRIAVFCSLAAVLASCGEAMDPFPSAEHAEVPRRTRPRRLRSIRHYDKPA